MHHFIYPSQDTFITNTVNYEDSNFGLDEILRIGTKNTTNRYTLTTKTFTYTSQSVYNLCVESFTGNITSGSLSGSAAYISGSITGGTGSISGSGFSGSGVIGGFYFTGSISGFNGWISDYSSSITSGIITGRYTVSQSYQALLTKKFVNRALLKFDLTSISESIVSGDISSPEFFLKLSVAREENLPITYSVYAYPISQSWNMGDGYLSDGGSVKGASWNYKDLASGSLWSIITDPSGLTPIDFIDDPSLTSLVWARGGGTWYTSAISSQSFNYEEGDINMNVSNIVNSWLSGSIPNQGFILISSDETETTGSDMGLYFFSQDSNTIYRPRLDASWNDVSWITGSVNTASVEILTLPMGYRGIITDATLSGVLATGSFSGVANYSSSVDVSSSISASGFMVVNGETGSISGLVIYGNFSGSITSSVFVSSSLGSGSVIQGFLLTGPFSGSQFTSSIRGFTIPYGIMSGNWTSQSVIGNQITGSYPFPFGNNTNAIIIGPYVNGTAFGTFTVSSSISSASFDGIFVNGILAGSVIHAEISGTFLTSSGYPYTGSVVIVSSSLEPVSFDKPFVTVIQNLQPTVKAGNIIRVNVFARPEFPFKNFQRRTQFTQYLTPQYLPTSSYYAIKDNETEQLILDFDNYTKLSCDTNGNYFLIDTTGLPQERYFKLLVKTELSSSVYTFDRNDVFKIVR